MNLFAVLPDLPTTDFANILPSLERHQISVSDLLTLDAADLARRAQVPIREVRRLTDTVLAALHVQLPTRRDEASEVGGLTGQNTLVSSGFDYCSSPWQTISTLDQILDNALGAGIPAGYLTEITGESGAGKTQFLLTLLLAVQLPAPRGLSRSALYISTEAPLSTARLSQMIKNHTYLSNLPEEFAPSLSRILAIQTPDLESQEHILRYQVPVAIKRHNVGLLIIDSITANYRAEFERREQGQPSERVGASMARRSAQLIELGTLLRDLARTENIAVVVANQVADRFDHEQRGIPNQNQHVPSSHPARTKPNEETMVEVPPPPPPPSTEQTLIPAATPRSSRDPMTLNHQQKFFTGWGDEPAHMGGNAKTPSLGLIWTNQIAARIALVKSPMRIGTSKGQRRMRIAFASWAAPTTNGGIPFQINIGGLTAVSDAG